MQFIKILDILFVTSIDRSSSYLPLPSGHELNTFKINLKQI